MHGIISFLQNLPQEVAIVFVSALPISELRGGIPWAVLGMKMTLPKAYLLAVAGNLLPVVPLLLLLEKLTRYLRRFPCFDKFLNWWFRSVERRGKLVERYEAIGLTLFVAIPLPVTGAWTGCAAAMLFKKKFRFALPAIILGVLIAGVIVSTLTWMVREGVLEGGGAFLKLINGA